ncbi:ZIP family metal transporter [Corallococcus exiguus]|uniref:ZIP family metal transporter n=1 Tax=Corallococcus TaxID=83461 RepID=UPI0011C3CF5E|nr:ZIP family metal transporter [Corallococcus sp. AB032C]NNB96907.1 ZIP family metal transporter [Corallococcus exiguus]NNC04789.1 ZIP family metal transporter [Corallococcus exiguus]NPC49673.1 ZIP family metal transporter [Corallococcus exiguus]
MADGPLMDANTVLLVFIAVGLDGLAGLAGGVLSERWLQRRLPALVAFAAGTLLSAVFLEVLPEAVAAKGDAAFAWAFASFVVLTLMEWALGHHHHDAEAAAGHAHGHHAPPVSPTLPTALLASDALHNVGDGAAVAAAFLVSPEAGFATAFAVIVHELPQEVGDYALLRAAGWTRARSLVALAGVQLTAAVGAAGVLLGTRYLPSLQGTVLAIAGGSFLYIGAVDLLPELRRGPDSRQRVVGFLCGLLLIGGLHFAERFAGGHG